MPHPLLYIYRCYNLNHSNKVLFSYLIKTLSSLPSDSLLKDGCLGFYQVMIYSRAEEGPILSIIQGSLGILLIL